MDIFDRIIWEQLKELTGHKGALTHGTVDKTGPGGSRSRGQFAKSWPGAAIQDPEDRPELQEAEPDVDPESLPPNPEDVGYNSDGFELEDRFEFQGIPISIEQKKGSEREWTDRNGKSGTTKMVHDYGYVEGSRGSDGESVDVYVGPDDSSEWVYVVHQMSKPDFTEYDEDKCMLGFKSEEDAREAYLKHYDDERFFGGLSSMPLSRFKEKLVGPKEKITNESIRGIVEGMGKGIPHIGDLKDQKFWEFIDALRSHDAEVTEKLDGSAFMEFGLKDGKVWAKSKNYGPVMDSRDWPTSRAVTTLQRAHRALEQQAEGIMDHWPEGASSVTCELLDGPVPNVIEYGPNAIVLHNTSEEFKHLARSVKLEGWELRTVPLKGHIFHESINDLSRSEVQHRMYEVVRSLVSSFGGQMVEGVVIRNKETNEMTKVVDKKMFTEYNKCMWRYRELLTKGIKEEGVWTPGIMKEFRDKVSEHAIGSKTLKLPAFASYMKRHYGEMKLWEALTTFIKDNGLFKEGYEDRYRKIADSSQLRFFCLAEQWEHSPKPVFKNNGFTFSMHPILVERTEAEFENTRDWFVNEVAIGTLSPLNMIIAALGQVRWFKLCEAFNVKVSSEFIEKRIVEALGDELFGDIPPDKEKDDEPGSKPLTGTGSLSSLDPSDEDDAKKILATNAEILKSKKQIDISKASVLGHGSQGTAFDIGGNRVLKVTKDDREAKASNKIKDDDLRYVAKVFDVFRFKDTMAYGIVQEKLQELTESEKRQINTLLVKTTLPLHLRKAQTWDEAIEEMWKFLENDRKFGAGGDLSTPEAKELIRKANRYLRVLEEKYNVKDSWEELKSKGITFSDYQGDNIMKRGSEYVLIDIGLSQVTGGAEPTTLEGMIKEMARSLFLEADGEETANPAGTIGVLSLIHI